MKIILSYIVVLASLAILDSIWLGVISKNFYQQHIGHLFRSDFVWPAIVLFYLLYAVAIIYFVIIPAGSSWSKALAGGLILGFTAYMTYGLVNYATLKDWPVKTAVIDILWGTVMTGMAAVTVVWIGKFFS